MEKNTVWAITLSTIVLVGFFAAQTYLFPNRNAVQNQPETNSVETAIDNSDKAQPEHSVVAGSREYFLPEESDSELSEELFTITTNKVRVTFTNKGGDIVGYELIEKDDKGNLKNKDTDTGKGVELVQNISDDNRAFAISLGNSSLPVINSIFMAKKLSDTSIGFFKKYKSNSGEENSFTLIKTYTFMPDDYTFKLDVTIDGEESFCGTNFGDALYTLRTSPQIGPAFNPKVNRYENRQFISFNGEKAKKIVLGTRQTKIYDKEWVWAAIAGKYFEIIVYPEKSNSMLSTVAYSSEVEVGDSSNAQAFLSRKPVSENQISDSYYIYAGPRNEAELKKYISADRNEWNLEGVRFNESLQTSGFLNWLEIILKFLLENINKLTRNWGVSIIVLTILLKIALFPITKKSLEGTRKMQKFQPKMQELQAKYKDNPQKLQIETAKMYQEIGYNPMSGCLPLLFQFIILWSMYNLFNNYFEFRGASFIPGWIDDLSQGDRIGKVFSKGLPLLGWNQIRILPVIYVISQLLFGKITQNGGTAAGSSTGQMKMMMYGMPIMFFFLFYNAPSGLLLYWTVSNIFQLVQQLFINKMMKNDDIIPVKAKKTKK